MYSIIMGTTFNRKPQKERRQYLRNNATYAEKILWYSLKGKQILGCKFRRQLGVNNYIMDFYCPELKLAIEADGGSHSTEDAKRYDEYRQRLIEREGICVLRFTDDEIVANPERVVKRIEKEIARLSSHTPAPPPRGGGGMTSERTFSPFLRGEDKRGDFTDSIPEVSSQLKK